jgi:hypothetical protein
MKLPLRSITVPRSISRTTRLRQLAGERGWTRIGGAEWAQMLAAVPKASPEDLSDFDIPVDPPWCGVRQHTLDELEASLTSLTGSYENRPDLRAFSRKVVIRAKDRAKWASKSRHVAEHKRSLKAEMAGWMLVWLCDPALFPAWVRIRRQRL